MRKLLSCLYIFLGLIDIILASIPPHKLSLDASLLAIGLFLLLLGWFDLRRKTYV